MMCELMQSEQRLSESTYLPRVVLQNILDVLNGAIQVLKAGGLLVLELILKLGNKLDVTYYARTTGSQFCAP